ncbi:MAG TPA: tetratricopeptide repeat protein [Pirellulales bacterium]|nr:tetratricopeptide repeat protein [Pirellulales bacterium]
MRSTSPTFLCCLLSASLAHAQDDWKGHRFMPKEGCMIKIGSNEIPAKGVALPYVVQQTSGDWLWIGEGWVQKSRVVPFDKASDYYTEYLRRRPNSAWGHTLRGWVHYENGKYDDAVRDFTDAIRLDPLDSLAYNNRGGARQKMGEFDGALDDYGQAIRLSPRETWGYNSTAWLLATCPKTGVRNGRRATEMARQACTLSAWKDAYSLDTLAAACAEAGEFDEAQRWQKKAIDLLAADPSFAAAARERLALYQNHERYREPLPE